MAGRVFINYRRGDTNAWAGRLHDRLAQTFSREQLFMDVDAIEPGLDFVHELDEQVAKCDVFLSIIGTRWLTQTDASGQRRLDNAEDFVRVEIESALRRNIRVIPVLVDGASMPRAEELPETLRLLARRNAVEVTHARFGSDSQALVEALSRSFGAPDPSESPSLGNELRTSRPAAQDPPPERTPLALPEKPSIAVLPFTNLSGDPGQDYFCDGITEDSTTELSRFSELFVIARNSSFQYKGKAVDVRQVGRELGVRYVLEGSIRRAGDRVRITAQLIDAPTGAHRWAERYDHELKDIFAVQDEVARTIVSILTAHVKKAEAERTLLKPPATWQAYDYYMRAVVTFDSFGSSFKAEELYETQRLLEHSLSIDPNYARASAFLDVYSFGRLPQPGG
jgi:TolB-like protein